MYHLHAALTDLVVADPRAAAALPRLPVLERLLARAERGTADADWRRWALSLAGLAAPAGDLPAGRTIAARAGLTVAPDSSWFVATPIRLVAGPSSVHFDPAGPLRLEAAVASALAARFAAEWHDDSLSLVADGGLLLLRLAGEVDVTTRDPAQLAGANLAAGAPHGPDAGRLQRLMTELQMWLHPFALRDRVGRPLNGLWLWGGGRGALSGEPHWPVLGCDDPFLAAAAGELAGAVAGRLLDAFSVADLVRAGGSVADADERWFAPLAARLADGELSSVQIHCAGSVHTLRAWHQWRGWRRTRPWWERIG